MVAWLEDLWAKAHNVMTDHPVAFAIVSIVVVAVFVMDEIDRARRYPRT